MNYLWAYIRLASYAVVFVSSLTHLLIKENNYGSKFIFISNLVVSALLAVAAIEQDVFQLNGLHIRATIVTPAIMLWVIFHLVSILKINSKI